MITTINEFKKINELSENKIELIFHLDFPYKWGKGWTASAESKDLLDMEAMSICNNLNLSSDIGQYVVVEGKPRDPNSNIIKSYMHAMEFVFTLKENNQTDIEAIKANVKDGISNLNEHFPISIKKIRLNNNGEYSTINESVDTEISALPVNVYKKVKGGDSTANGLTSHKTDLMLVFDGVQSPFTVQEGEDYLVLKTKSFRGKKYKYCVPKSILDSGNHSMFGGNFVYSSDSRFPNDYPLPVHDRVE